MDSLTQLTLGAAVGEAVLGRKAGYKAAGWGAVMGTLPDLDIIMFPFWDEVQRLTLHRGATHSLFLLTLAAPLFARIIRRWHPEASWREWTWLCWLALITHPLLDCFTTYGTQIFWPIRQLVAWNTIFIIDPAYSAPLALGLLGTLWTRRQGRRRPLFNYLGFVLSTGYLVLAGGAKFMANAAFERAIREAELPATQVISLPTPFNAILWRVLIRDGDAVHVGYYSLLDEQPNTDFETLPVGTDLIEPMRGRDDLERLIWFSRGYFQVFRENDGLFYRDLRFGHGPNYFFTYRIGPAQPGAIEPGEILKWPVPRPSASDWLALWQRLLGH